MNTRELAIRWFDTVWIKRDSVAIGMLMHQSAKGVAGSDSFNLHGLLAFLSGSEESVSVRRG